jgi:hypothetical protein
MIKDIGRAISYREMIVKDCLKGLEFTQISRRTNHSIDDIANYVDKFKRVVALPKDNCEIHKIAFFVKISKSLAQQYYDLHQTAEIVEQRRKELDELLITTTVQY